MKGVVRTRVGYAGGKAKDPTYTRLGDHTEAIQIDYDPDVLDYRDLVEVFWRSHNAAYQSPSRQYRNILFYHDEDQKRIALETKKLIGRDLEGEVATEIVPYTGFHLAEEYHQKYVLRRHPDLLEEFEAMYPSAEAIRNSTAAARVNGYLAGDGSADDLMKEVPKLGLTETGSDRLSRIVRGGSAPVRCAVPGKTGAASD